MSLKINLEFDKNLKTLLKKSRVNFLFGAGASYYLKEDESAYPLMNDIVQFIIQNEVYKLKIDELDEHNIIKRCHNKYMVEEKNFESFLSAVEGLTSYPMDEKILSRINEFINLCKKLLIERLSISNTISTTEIYSTFYDKLQYFNRDKEETYKRLNVFTTNYDMLSELALENLSIHYFSGFTGLNNRKFNSAYYNFTYSDDMNLNTRNYLVKKDHVNLYKLHGSLSWSLKNGNLCEIQDYESNSNPVIIYPSHTKYNNTNLIVYYSTLMREFLNQISKEQTTLVVIGYSFSDEHINQLIDSALTIDSFTLVACIFSNKDLENLNSRFINQSNIKVYKGEMSTLSKFADFLGESSNE